MRTRGRSSDTLAPAGIDGANATPPASFRRWGAAARTPFSLTPASFCLMRIPPASLWVRGAATPMGRPRWWPTTGLGGGIGRAGRPSFFFVVFLLEVLSFFFDYLCKTFCIKLLGFQNFSVSFFCVIFLSKNFCASYDFAKIFLPKFLKKTFVNQICQKLFCFPKMFLPNFLKLFFAKFSPKTFVHKILPKSMFFNNFLQNFFLIYIFFSYDFAKIFLPKFLQKLL
jgi:hypothetical protein